MEWVERCVRGSDAVRVWVYCCGASLVIRCSSFSALARTAFCSERQDSNTKKKGAS